MQCWINVPIAGRIDDKIKMTTIILKTNISSIHHSTISFPGQKSMADVVKETCLGIMKISLSATQPTKWC